MKKWITIVGLVLFCGKVTAQSWLPTHGRVRIQDIIAAHENAKDVTTEQEDEDLPKGVVKEDKDYHFERWLWYWKQHTDADGYLVPSVRTYREWLAYENEHQSANKNARTTGTTANWVFQGPDTSSGGYSGLGRINVIAFHPTDVNTFWIGSPGGGAWKTTNAGASWTCMTDMLPVLSVSDIDINPLNPNTIYLCTGDRDAGDYYSIGVLKSTNGGASWDTTGLKWATSLYQHANALVINPIDTNSLLMAGGDGIYQSHDGGAHWAIVTTGNFKEIKYNPADTNIVYAASVYTYSPTLNAQVYRSVNGGATWTAVTSFSNANRVSIAVTAANPKIVKVLVANQSGPNASGLNGIYSSSDSGRTFRLTYAGDCTHNMLSYSEIADGCGGQSWYDLCIEMSPVDSNKVFIGGVNSWYSLNGGTTWTLMTFWYGITGFEIAHADKHYMAVNPLVPGNLYQCNDGGVYMTTDPTNPAAWNNRLSNGLGITEFYRIAVESNASFVLGGAQDNGTKRVDGHGTYYDIGGGDGMECQIDPIDSSIYYYAFQNGSVVKHDDALPPGNQEKNISDAIHSTGAWVTPYQLLPSCNTCLIAGYRAVYLSVDAGDSWSRISDSFSLSPYTHVERLATTVADENTICALVDYYDTVFCTHDLGVTWNHIRSPYSSYGNMSDIRVDYKDKARFWVTFGGYDNQKVAEYNETTGWKPSGKNLPNVPITCIIQDTSNGYLYVGTEVGVFYRGDTMTLWQPFNTNLPAVRVSDLGINYTTGEIWAGTYGRGIWKSEKYGKPNGISIVPFAANALVISPNPNHGDFAVTVPFAKDKMVLVKIFDLNGKTVWQQNSQCDANGKMQVTTSDLPRGTYIVDVSATNVSIGRQKVIVY